MPQTVVVGVDGSEESVKALRWAADHICQVGGLVHAITVWHQPVQFGYRMAATESELEGQARETLGAAVATVQSEYPRADVRSRVIRGNTVDEFIALSRQADLMVVGDKGHGAFTGMLVGSVALKIVHHAVCPVVVVR